MFTIHYIVMKLVVNNREFANLTKSLLIPQFAMEEYYTGCSRIALRFYHYYVGIRYAWSPLK